jgi:hypothetical protein
MDDDTAPALVSIANLAADEWTLCSYNSAVVTVGLWLDEAIARHRQELTSAGLTGPLTLRYQLNGHDVDGDIRRVRDVMDELHETYRWIKTTETAARPERYALLAQLSEARVMPSEIRVAERFFGDDEEARIARTLLHHIASDRGGVDA